MLRQAWILNIQPIEDIEKKENKTNQFQNHSCFSSIIQAESTDFVSKMK